MAGGDPSASPAPPPDPLRVLESASPAEAPPPNDRALADEPKNDLGNAARLRSRYGRDLRYVRELGREGRNAWLVWEPNEAGGGIWKAGAHLEAQRLAHRTGEAVRDEAAALRESLTEAIEAALAGGDKGRAKALEKRIEEHAKWSVQCGNTARIEAMLKVAAPYLQVSNRDLDADPMRLAVANGTLALPADGEGEIPLLPGRREDLITRRCAARYDPEAGAPRFRAFLEQILPSQAVRRFLQQWFGYCLTGLIDEQLVVLFYGTGGNGKSTLLNIVRGVLDGYALTLPFESFLHDDRRRGGGPTPDLVRLPGGRMLTASEPEVGVRLSEAMIKSQTGGEPMMVRPLFEDPFEFLPTHKVVLSFNAKPKIVAQDEGTWRRLALIEFAQRLTGPKPHPPFDQQVLREEASGVLNWMLDGFRLWREAGGLEVPDEVREATAEYRTDSDPLAEFLAALVRPTKGLSIRAGEFYAAYQVWARANATEPISNTRFGKLLPERGYRKERVGGTVYYLDVEIDRDALEELRQQGGAEP